MTAANDEKRKAHRDGTFHAPGIRYDEIFAFLRADVKRS
jgi:hypothetical protein